MTVIEVDTYGYVPDEDYTDPPPFWALLIMGIVWIFLSFLVLDFSYTSITTIACTSIATISQEVPMTLTIQRVTIPNSALAREITELVRDTESPLLFHHSSRVYYWGALAGQRSGLKFDAELLYAGAMFHDMGLTPQYRTPHERFEVDSANTARDFLRSRGIAQADLDTVWSAEVSAA